ncbi:MAG: TIGR02757 family protein [Bacteroidales bacterium]|nr:TIGR02757 family protein [Bacteroidales bacterium]
MKKEIIKILEELVKKNESFDFIKTDPIQIPKIFKEKKDIEITAFITAIISWGNRKQIINNGYKLIKIMNSKPYDFIMRHRGKEFYNFKHRTFNEKDLNNVIFFLKTIYSQYQSMEDFMFEQYLKCSYNIRDMLINFRKRFKEIIEDSHTLKHISNIEKNSPGKRLNMFLRWMIRDGKVDFGIWNKFNKSELYIPLDIHVGRNARALKLLQRKSNDWKSVEELTYVLKQFDSNDPVKYDFALFNILNK